MKRLAVIAAIMLASSPAFAMLTLKSCTMVNTMNGVRWLGVYCDSQRNCVQQMFRDYCPYMI